jgi:hypothetical protein
MQLLGMTPVAHATGFLQRELLFRRYTLQPVGNVHVVGFYGKTSPIFWGVGTDPAQVPQPHSDALAPIQEE